MSAKVSTRRTAKRRALVPQWHMQIPAKLYVPATERYMDDEESQDHLTKHYLLPFLPRVGDILGPGAEQAGSAFIIDQVKPDTGAFDELKVVIGPASVEEAEQVYLRNYPPDWQGLGAITEVPIGDLKQVLADADGRPVGKKAKGDGGIGASAMKLASAWGAQLPKVEKSAT